MTNLKTLPNLPFPVWKTYIYLYNLIRHRNPQLKTRVAVLVFLLKILENEVCLNLASEDADIFQTQQRYPIIPPRNAFLWLFFLTRSRREYFSWTFIGKTNTGRYPIVLLLIRKPHSTWNIHFLTEKRQCFLFHPCKLCIQLTDDIEDTTVSYFQLIIKFNTLKTVFIQSNNYINHIWLCEKYFGDDIILSLHGMILNEYQNTTWHFWSPNIRHGRLSLKKSHSFSESVGISTVTSHT